MEQAIRVLFQHYITTLLSNLFVSSAASLPWPWSSLVKGHEQLDRPNSQTCMECCHACASWFWGFALTQQLTTWADTAFISYYKRDPEVGPKIWNNNLSSFPRVHWGLWRRIFAVPSSEARRPRSRTRTASRPSTSRAGSDCGAGSWSTREKQIALSRPSLKNKKNVGYPLCND